MGYVNTAQDGDHWINGPATYWVDGDSAYFLGGGALDRALAANLLQSALAYRYPNCFEFGIHDTANGGGWRPVELGEHLDHILNPVWEALAMVLADILPTDDHINTASQAAFDDDETMALIRDNRGHWRYISAEDSAADRDSIPVGGGGVKPEDQLRDIHEIRRLCHGDEWTRLVEIIGPQD